MLGRFFQKTCSSFTLGMLSCGSLNFMTIGFCNMFSETYENYRACSKLDPASRNKQYWSSTLNSMVKVFIKSSIYGLLGPIGTYRMSLSMWNFFRTKDDGWVIPLCCYNADTTLFRGKDPNKYYILRGDRPGEYSLTPNAKWLPIIFT